MTCNLSKISKLVITEISKNCENIFTLFLTDPVMGNCYSFKVEIKLEDVDHSYDSNLSVAIGGYFCALVASKKAGYICYRLYYTKDDYLLIKTSHRYKCLHHSKPKLIFTNFINGQNSIRLGSFDYRSELFDYTVRKARCFHCDVGFIHLDENKSNRLIQFDKTESNEMDISKSSPESSTHNTDITSDNLESLEIALKEKRLQKLEDLTEIINTKLNQIKPLHQEVKELRKRREKILRDLHPVIYQIRFPSPFEKYCYQGYFSSRQKAQDMIERASFEDGREYSITSTVSIDIEQNIADILDEIPENKEWISYN